MPMNRRDILKLSCLTLATAKVAVFSRIASATNLTNPMLDMKSVAEFDIYPDGVTNWEDSSPRWREMLEASVEHGVYWPPGYYATGINFDRTLSGSRMHFISGSVIGGVFHLISGENIKNFSLASILRTSNVATLKSTAPHSFVSGEKIQVRNVYASGVGAVDFNVESVEATVVDSYTISFPQLGPNATGIVIGASAVSSAPIVDVSITGLLTTTDRLGTINAKNCRIERCWVKNDPDHHSGSPGLPCRGAHIYAGTDGLIIDDLVIDYAAAPNTGSALAIDGYAWNPSNCKFGFVHIKDSAFQGAYITGYGHTFGELRIDAFAKEAPDGNVLQDSNGAPQCAQMKGLWINRCWDTRINVLRTSQNTSDGTRAFEKYQVLIDETGHAFYNARSNGVSIGAWYADNVRRCGIAISDPTFISPACNVSIDSLQIKPDRAGVTAGEYLLRCNPASLKPNVSIGSLRFVGTLGSQNLYVDPGVNFVSQSTVALA